MREDSTSLPVGSRYESLFKLAAGGMAEVWVARQRGGGRFQRPVALKRMLPHLREDEGFVAMFLDEGTLAGAISHPNVVATYDVGVDDEGRPYLVMELVVGVSLSQMLRASRGDIPLALGIEILAQACDGLHAAHTARSPAGKALEIVHRDVSPQNILIGEDGRVRIGDFGVARALERLTQTTTGEVKGKASYFSPEQARANVALDARSDVFSMGIVAWEVLAGRRLFGGMSPVSALARILSDEPIDDVDTVRLTVPEGVADVVATALVKDRDGRFDSAAALGAALRNAARSVGFERPEASEISAFVARVGGDDLLALKERIAVAFEGSPDAVQAPDTEGTDPSIDVDVSTGSVPSTTGPSTTPSATPSTTPSAMSGMAADATPPTTVHEVLAQRRSKVPWVAVAVAVLLSLGVGVGAYFGSRTADATADDAAADEAPAPIEPVADPPTSANEATRNEPPHPADGVLPTHHEAPTTHEAPSGGVLARPDPPAEPGPSGEERVESADRPTMRAASRLRLDGVGTMAADSTSSESPAAASMQASPEEAPTVMRAPGLVDWGTVR